MAEFSSIVVIQTNEAGQPTNLVAFSEGDTIASSILSPETKDVLVRVEDSSASWDAGLDAGTYNNLVITSGRAEDMVTFSTNVQTSTSEISAIVDASVGSGLVDVCSYITAEEGGWTAGLDPGTLEDITEVSGDVKNVLAPFSGNIETSTRGLSGLLDTSVGSGLADVCSYITAEETGWAAGLDPTVLAQLTEVSGDVKDVLSPFSGNIEASTRGLSGLLDTSVGSGLADVCSYITAEETGWAAGLDPGTLDDVTEVSGDVKDVLAPVSGTINQNAASLGGTSSMLQGVSSMLGGVSSNLGGTSSMLQGVSSMVGGVSSNLGGASSTLGTFSADVQQNIGAVSSTSGTNFLGGATPTLSNDLLTNGNDINAVGNQLHLSADLFVLSAADNVLADPPGGVYIAPNTYLLGGKPGQNSQLRLSGNGMLLLSESENYTFGTTGRLATVPMFDFYEDTKSVSSMVGGVSSNLGGTSSMLEGVSSMVGGVSSNLGGTSSMLEGVSSNLGGTSSMLQGVSSMVGGVSANLGGASSTLGTFSGDVQNRIGAVSSTSGTNFLGGATPTLANNLDGNNKQILGVNKIRSDTLQTRLDTGTLGVSGPNLTLYGEDVIRIGKLTNNFVTQDFKASADNWNETHNTVYSLSDGWGGGGGGGGSFEGSAVASAIAIGDGSSVQISGVDNTTIDTPTNGMVLVLDTVDARMKYSKISGPQLVEESVGTSQLSNGAVTGDKIANGAVSATQITDGQITTAKLENNINIDSKLAANDINFNSIRLIGAETLVGNKAAIGGPLDDLTTTEVRTMLNVADGATANTGALADLDTVDTAQIDDDAITQAKVSGGYLPLTTGGQVSGDIELKNSADLIFNDSSGSFPTQAGAFKWNLNNDNAQIYAEQPANDQIDFYFKIADNAAGKTDRYIYWIDDYRGASYDRYPLYLDGSTQYLSVPVDSAGTKQISNAVLQVDYGTSSADGNVRARNDIIVGDRGASTRHSVSSVIESFGSVSGNIATNTTNITNLTTSSSELSSAIDTNTGNIATNTANISVLGGVSGNIATNTGNISTNTGNISVLGGVSGNIATNTGNISTNTGNISTNTGNISTNTGNITALGSASGNWNTIYGDRANIISVSSTVLNNSGTWGGGGGGGTTVHLFNAGYSGTGSIPTALNSVVVWDLPGLNQMSFDYDDSTGVFTVDANTRAKYLEFNINVGGDGGSARVELNLELQKDTGSGYTAIAKADNYAVRTTSQNEGGCWLTYIDPAVPNNGDKYRVTLRRVGGGLNFKALANYINIKQYS